MQEFINAHCHILNFQFVTDSYFRTRGPFPKWLLRNKATRWIVRRTPIFIPVKKMIRFMNLWLLGWN